MAKEFTSFFMLRSDATEQFKVIEQFSENKVVSCEVISTDGNYLVARVRMREEPKLTGILQIPHNAIALIGDEVEPSKPIGFSAATMKEPH